MGPSKMMKVAFLLCMTGAQVVNGQSFDHRTILGIGQAPAYPEMDEIAGAFAVRVIARFDELSSRQWQRVFDFSNGLNQIKDTIYLSQHSSNNAIRFLVSRGGTTRHLTAPLDLGVETTWEVGVDENLRMYIKKDGVELVHRTDGVLPEGVIRSYKLIGRSTYDSSDDLVGAVRGLRFLHGASSYSGLPWEFWNVPSQLFHGGGIVMSAYVRFDAVLAGTWQKVICLGNGPLLATASLGQEWKTNNIRFAIHNTPSSGSTITADNAIIEGEMAFWEAGVTNAGYAWIKKNGVLLASKQVGFLLPSPESRINTLIGYSNWPSDTPLKGAILGGRVDLQDGS